MYGINDIIFGGVEMFGKHKDRYIGIEECSPFLYIFLQLANQQSGIFATPGTSLQAFCTAVDFVYRMSEIEEAHGQRQTVAKVEEVSVFVRKNVKELTDGQNEAM